MIYPRRLGFFVIAAVASCADSSEPAPDPVIATSEVSTAEPMAWIGATRDLTATAYTSSGAVVSGTTFTWSSSQSGVATVNSNGRVTAVSNGTATISATASNVSGSTTVTVQQV